MSRHTVDWAYSLRWCIVATSSHAEGLTGRWGTTRFWPSPAALTVGAPTVYRARYGKVAGRALFLVLARDGLTESAPEHPKAGDRA